MASITGYLWRAPGSPNREFNDDGFPICTLGWSDKTFFSTSGTTPKDYDPTARPWYTAAISASGVIVTKPYGDVTTHIPYVAFATPIVRDGKPIGALSGAVTLDLGITQVDSSIAEMDRATQQNAVLVEQSAAASSQLNEQAHGLFEIIGLFKLREVERRV